MMRRVLMAIGVALALGHVAGAQMTAVWTKVVDENYDRPSTITVTVPANATVVVRWGSGGSFVSRTFLPGTNTFTAANTYFGDPAPGVAKELDVQGRDLEYFKIDGKQQTAPTPTVVDMIVTPMMITATTGTAVPTKAMCKYSDGTTSDCTAAATYSYIKGGVAAYPGAGTIIGTQAGPAEVDVTVGAITVKLGVLIVDLPIYFNGGLMLAPN